MMSNVTFALTFLAGNPCQICSSVIDSAYTPCHSLYSSYLHWPNMAHNRVSSENYLKNSKFWLTILGDDQIF